MYMNKNRNNKIYVWDVIGDREEEGVEFLVIRIILYLKKKILKKGGIVLYCIGLDCMGLYGIEIFVTVGEGLGCFVMRFWYNVGLVWCSGSCVAT